MPAASLRAFIKSAHELAYQFVLGQSQLDLLLERLDLLTDLEVALLSLLLIVIKLCKQPNSAGLQLGKVLLVSALDLGNLKLDVFHLEFNLGLPNALKVVSPFARYLFLNPLLEYFAVVAIGLIALLFCVPVTAPWINEFRACLQELLRISP